MPLIIQLFNPNVKILAIDEPELGLEPAMQKKLFGAIRAASEGIGGFPLKRVLMATHSHLFLDRENINNNFSIQKINGIVHIQPLTNIEDVQRATYNLLGSNPNDLFFPSNVVIVEGITDQIFLNAVYQIGKRAGLFLSQNLVFHFIDGYDKLPIAGQAIVQMLKTQAYAPVYKERICGLFDKPKQNRKMIEKVRKYFGDTDNTRFVLLDLEAIEYYYPLSIVNDIFNEQHLDLKTYHVEVDRFLEPISKQRKSHGEFFKETLSKREFVNLIVNKLGGKHLAEIDPSIIALLKKADALAYV